MITYLIALAAFALGFILGALLGKRDSAGD